MGIVSGDSCLIFLGCERLNPPHILRRHRQSYLSPHQKILLNLNSTLNPRSSPTHNQYDSRSSHRHTQGRFCLCSSVNNESRL